MRFPASSEPHTSHSSKPSPACRQPSASAKCCCVLACLIFPLSVPFSRRRARCESPARSRTHRVSCACGSSFQPCRADESSTASDIVFDRTALHHNTQYSNGARKGLLNRRTPAIWVCRHNRGTAHIRRHLSGCRGRQRVQGASTANLTYNRVAQTKADPVSQVKVPDTAERRFWLKSLSARLHLSTMSC